MFPLKSPNDVNSSDTKLNRMEQGKTTGSDKEPKVSPRSYGSFEHTLDKITTTCNSLVSKADNATRPHFQSMREHFTNNRKVYIGSSNVLERVELALAIGNALKGDSTPKIILAAITILANVGATWAKVGETLSSQANSGAGKLALLSILNLSEGAVSALAIWASAKTGSDKKDQAEAEKFAIAAIGLIVFRCFVEVRQHYKSKGDESTSEKRLSGILSKIDSSDFESEKDTEIIKSSTKPSELSKLRPRGRLQKTATTSRNSAAAIDKKLDPFPPSNVEFLKKEVKLRHAINSASLHESRGEKEQTVKEYKKAIKIKGDLFRQPIIVNIPPGLKDLAEIGSIYKQALGINKKLNKDQREADDLSYSGARCHTERKFDKAIEFYLKALNLNIGLHRDSEIASNYGHLGCAYQDDNQLGYARICYLKAYKKDHELKRSTPGMANNCSNLAGLYRIMANQARENGNQLNSSNYYKRAVTYYNQALQINQSIKAKEGIASTHGSLGRLHQDFNKLKEAITSYKESCKFFEKINAPSKKDAADKLLFEAENLFNLTQPKGKVPGKEPIVDKLKLPVGLMNKGVTINSQYMYEGEDIEALLDKYLDSPHNKEIISRGSSVSSVSSLINIVKPWLEKESRQNRLLLVPYQPTNENGDANNHWIGVAFALGAKKELHICCADSLNIRSEVPADIKSMINLLTQDQIAGGTINSVSYLSLSHSKQGDGTSCGAYVVHNLSRVIDYWSRTNQLPLDVASKETDFTIRVAHVNTLGLDSGFDRKQNNNIITVNSIPVSNIRSQDIALANIVFQLRNQTLQQRAQGALLDDTSIRSFAERIIATRPSSEDDTQLLASDQLANKSVKTFYAVSKIGQALQVIAEYDLDISQRFNRVLIDAPRTDTDIDKITCSLRNIGQSLLNSPASESRDIISTALFTNFSENVSVEDLNLIDMEHLAIAGNLLKSSSREVDNF